MTVNDCKWPTNGWKRMKLAANGWKRMKLAANGWKFLEIAQIGWEMAGNDWKQLKILKIARTCYKMDGNCLKLFQYSLKVNFTFLSVIAFQRFFRNIIWCKMFIKMHPCFILYYTCIIHGTVLIPMPTLRSNYIPT